MGGDNRMSLWNNRTADRAAGGRIKMKAKVGRRITAFMMAAVMTFTTVPVNALAVETTDAGTGGLCEHHPAHTAECGYTEGTSGSPCAHEHDEDCYQFVTECVHEHTEDCYPEENASDDTASPSEPEDAGPTECTHECSEESGCITEKLDCEHEHDEACGYAPAEPGSPCTFVCGECGQADGQEDGQTDEQADGQTDEQINGQSDEPADEQTEAVQAQIDAIPDTDELAEMTAEEQQAEYKMIQAAFDAYNALTDEQKAKITGAEAFDSLFAFFNGMTNALAVSGPVKYLDENGDGQWVYSYTSISSLTRDTAWSDDKNDGWYVVDDTTTIISKEITVGGDVHLVLTDGHRLLPRSGIRIEENSSLTIYCQQSKSGVLSVKGYSTTSESNPGVDGGAAISIGDGGTLTINGGKVYAVGGNGNIGTEGYGGGEGGTGGAGIGGTNGAVIINGGTVIANGGNGGKGGNGSWADNGGRGGAAGEGIVAESITINNGTVEATGGNGGEGSVNTSNNNKRIGPGGNGAAGISGTLTIGNGSVKKAQGGTGGTGTVGGADAPGISISEGEALTASGGTVSATGGGNGAGISVGDGGDLTVDGGKVTATGRTGISTGAAAITISKGSMTATGNNAGTGVAGSSGISIGDGGNLTIEGGKVTATGGDGGKGNDNFGSGGPGENGGTGISVSANGNITINDGSLTATGGKGGAGNSGNERAGRGGNGGAGISVSGSININGGIVKAIGNTGGNGVSAGNKGGDGGNGGAGIVSENEGVTITGGTVTATGGVGGRGHHFWAGKEFKAQGGNGGAGIVSENGSTTITGGAVTATGSSGGESSGDLKPGSAGSGVGGTFSTGSDGDAMIRASSIDDNEEKSSWRGIIFDGNSGGVYGNQRLQENLEISDGQELTIPEGSTLTIPEDVTLNNDGTFTNNGHITGGGTLTGSGTLTGNGTIADTIHNTFIRDSLVTIHFEGEDVTGNTAIYGSSLTIQATVQPKANTLSLRQNTVDFYQGDPKSDGRKLNKDPIPVVNNIATLENVAISGDAWALNTYTIYAVYDGSITMQPVTGRASLSVKGDLGTADVRVNGVYAYTGSPVTPEVNVTWNGNTLTDGTDYELTYVNSNGGEGKLTNAGTVTVTATGTGNYTGMKTATFTIAQSSTELVGGVTVDREDKTYTYGDTITVSVTPKATGTAAARNSRSLFAEPTAPEAGQMAIYEGDRQLTGAQDVTTGKELIFKLDTVEAGLGSGSHELTARFVGSEDMAEQSGTVEVKIEPAPLSDAEVTVSGGPFVYDGNAKTPTVSVTWNGTTLTDGADYKLTYENTNGGESNLTNAGTVTVTATGTGNYTGTQTATFTIAQSSTELVGGVTVDREDGTYIYGDTITVNVTPKATGTEVTRNLLSLFTDPAAPEAGQMAIYEGDRQLTGAQDVITGKQLTFKLDTVETKLGTGTHELTARFVGSEDMSAQSGTVKVKVNPASLSDADVKVSGAYVYTGSAVTPEVSVEWKGRALVSETDYTLSYQNSNGGAGNLTNAGTVTVTATGTGNYTGMKTATFTIAQSETAFEGGVTVDREDKTYTYGDTITVSVTPKATGTAVTRNLLSLFTEPAAGQMAIYEGDRQLTGAQDVITGRQLTFKLDTVEADLGNGEHELTARFVGSEDMAAQSGTVKVKVNPAPLSDAKVAVSGGPFVYDGKEKAPTVSVTWNETTLNDGADYKLTYVNSNGGEDDLVSAGTVTVTAAGTGNYTGTQTATFTIAQSETEFVGGVTVDREDGTYTYGDTIIVSVTPKATGTAVTRNLLSLFTEPTAGQMAIYEGDRQLTEAQKVVTGKQLTFKLDTAAAELGTGTHKLTARFVGSEDMAAQSGMVEVKIEQAPISEAEVTVSGEYVYTGSPVTPVVSVEWKGRALVSGTDYTLSYQNSNGGEGNLTNAGTITVTATGTGNYTGAQTATFTIAQSSTEFVGGVMVDHEDKTYTYGDTITVSVTPKATGVAVVRNLLSFFAEPAAPEAGQMAIYEGDRQLTEAQKAITGKQLTFKLDTVKIGLGSGAHELTARFVGSEDMESQTGTVKVNIKPALISEAEVTVSGGPFIYDGNAKTPTVSVTWNETTLTDGADYKLTYENTNGGVGNLTNAGTVTVTATGTGNYTGTQTATFMIAQSATELAGGVTVDREDKTYTYGDAITVSVTPKATGESAARNLRSLFAEPAAPEAGQMAIYEGDRQLTGAQDVTTGKELTFTLNTVEAELGTGTHELTARFVGSEDMAAQSGTVKVKVNSAPLSDADVKVSGAYVYTGSSVTPDVSVEWKGMLLTNGTDYELRYENSNGGEGNLTNAGTVTVTATGRGNYTGTQTATFTITQSETEFVGGVTVDREDGTYTYGDMITVSVTPKATGIAAVRNLLSRFTEPAAGQMAIYEGDRQLTEAQNVTTGKKLTFKLDTVEAGLGNGEHELTARFAGSEDMAAQSGTVEVKIESAPLSDADVKVSGKYVYTGSAVTPDVSVEWKGRALVSGTDYTLSYQNSNGGEGNLINAGTVTVTATGTGNYTGTKTATFTITQSETEFVGGVTVDRQDKTYTYGDTITVSVTPKATGIAAVRNLLSFFTEPTAPEAGQMAIYEGDRQLTWAQDVITGRQLTFKLDTVEAGLGSGEHELTARFVGSKDMAAQSGTVEVKIEPAPLSDAEVTVSGGPFIYDGNAKTPVVSIMWKKTMLTSGTDYELSYENTNGGAGNLTNAGTVTVTATGTGNYTGTQTATFTITQSETEFVGGVTVDREDKTYTYGDMITISVTPKATGTAAVRNSLALLTEPEASAAGQMAIYEGDRQLTGAQDVTTGKELIFKLDTAEAGLGTGTHELTARFVGSEDMAAQSGTVEVKIEPAPLSDAEVAISDGPFIYDGNAKTPTVSVTWNETTLTSGTDYELSFENTNGGAGNLTNAGTVTVTATGTGNYTGTRMTTFTIDKAAAPAVTWPVAGSIIYGQKLSESILNGGSTEYGSFAWEMPDTVPPVSNDGYTVVFTPSGETEQNYETIVTTKQAVAVPVEKAASELKLLSSVTELTGRGQVELKLTGLPEGGKAELICSDSGIRLETGENNTWKATLPNRSQTYIFTATYSGDDNHNAAEASCQVAVTGRSSSGGSSGTGGGPSTVIQPDQDKPQAPSTGQATPVLPGSDGNAGIDNGVVQDAINNANADAKKNGSTANGIAVTVPIQNAQGTKNLSIIIKAETLDMLVAAEVRRFEITTNGLPSFGFTMDTLRMLDTRFEGGDLILRMSQTAVNSAEARTAVGARPAYEISLVYVRDGREISLTDWQGKTVSVKLPYIPAANEQAGSLYAVSVDGSGKVQWILKSAYDVDQKAVIFEAGQFGICGVGYQDPVPAFTDIDSHWAKDHILFTVSRGLLSGTGETSFRPDAVLTRGMLATALGRLAGIDPAAYQTGTFADVKADAGYAAYVNWAAATGIISGITSATFEPDGIITHEQMAVIMKAYADKMGYSVPKTLAAVTFLDNAQILFQAKDAVREMQQAGVLSGKGNRFDPQGSTTRAEAAAALHRFVEVIIDPRTAYGWARNDSQDD